MKRRCIVFVFICSSIFTYGQQEGVFSQFLENPVMINPACVGFNKGLNVELRTRTIQKNIPGGHFLNGDYGSILLFNAHRPINYGRMGVGIKFFKQVVKQWFTSQYVAQYSYRINFLNGQLGFGLEGGLRSYSTQWGSSNPEHEDDPVLTEQREFTPDMGAGLFYQDEKLMVGISGKQLLGYQLSNDLQARQYRTWHGIASYKLLISDEYVFEPGVYLKYTKDVFQADVVAKLLYKNMIWVGAGARTELQYVIFAGVHIHEVFKIYQDVTFGYAYDSGLSAVYSPSVHSQELFLHLNLSGRPSKKKLERRKLVASPMHF